MERKRTLIGQSNEIQEVNKFISAVAAENAPVLLTGASGTGKELVAQAIHAQSHRRNGAFVAINCASLSEGLVDSELFGHEKGAFTGAISAAKGKFEAAKGGTLFLDEIGELSPNVQARLLRVIQEKEFFRLGGVEKRKTDVRIIAATHKNLNEEIKLGTFREDLYFRLNVFSCHLPSLYLRKEDVPILTDYFLDKLNSNQAAEVRLSVEVKRELLKYHYPGNVRELQNIIERLFVIGRETKLVTFEMLPQEMFVISKFQVPELSVKLGSLSLRQMVDSFEMNIVMQTLKLVDGNQSKAASLLGVSRGMIRYKLRKPIQIAI